MDNAGPFWDLMGGNDTTCFYLDVDAVPNDGPAPLPPFPGHLRGTGTYTVRATVAYTAAGTGTPSTLQRDVKFSVGETCAEVVASTTTKRQDYKGAEDGQGRFLFVSGKGIGDVPQRAPQLWDARFPTDYRRLPNFPGAAVENIGVSSWKPANAPSSMKRIFYTFGGGITSNSGASRDIYKLDTNVASPVWVKLTAQLGVPRGSPCAAWVDNIGRIVIAGGARFLVA